MALNCMSARGEMYRPLGMRWRRRTAFGRHETTTWRLGQLSRDRVSPDRCVYKACSHNLSEAKRLTIRGPARLHSPTHASRARASENAPSHTEHPMRVPAGRVGGGNVGPQPSLLQMMRVDLLPLRLSRWTYGPAMANSSRDMIESMIFAIG